MSFVATAEHGSFVAAARALNVSGVAVSRAVARLEVHLGVRLFARTTRSMSITTDGAAFLARCRTPLAGLEHAVSSTQTQGTALAGVVRVTALSPLVRDYIAPALPRFIARYPNITLELEANETVARMIVDQVDLGIRASARPDAGFVARPLGDLQFALTASPAYLKLNGIPRDVAALAQHHALVLRRPGDPPPAGLPLGRGTQMIYAPMQVAFISNDLPALLAAAVRGCGIARLPVPVALPALRSGALKIILPHTIAPLRAFLHYPSRKQMPQRIRVVRDFLLETLQDHADFSVDVKPFFA